MSFTDSCTKCYHKMENIPADCFCGCHEAVKLLSKLHDCSIEQTIADIKQAQENMESDPIELAKAQFLHESGIADIMWKKAKQKVADK